LLPLLDQTRIVQAANLADRLAGLGKTGSVLTRLHGETLSNEGFRHSFASGQRTIGAFPRHLVLSLPQVEVAHFTNADWQTLARLGAAGFGFAITSITTLDMDFQGLAARGFVIARLDADTFLNGLPAEGMRIPPGDICRHFAACELALVVGRIDDDQQLARIFGFGVLFGQGQVFGGPRAVNPDAHVRGAATASSLVATA
jgi:cyclic-di-GMP phosphodiesterase TipF (flagellum assembly factor)